MIYGKEYHILSTKEVETFFHHLIKERKVNFHPDDIFEDYDSYEGEINTFRIDEYSINNRLMNEVMYYDFLLGKTKNNIPIHTVHNKELVVRPIN